MSIVIAILIFSLIIIFHEFGHCIVAKKNGIRVEEFSVGLGPKLVGFKKGETFYCIKLLPFGGACVMTGEDEASDDPKSFSQKSVWARMAVVFAGPFFNFILAFLLSIVLISMIGVDEPYISEVVDGSAAMEAGLKQGDKITGIDGTHIGVYRDISNYLTLHPGKADDVLTITYIRDGEKNTCRLSPKYDEESGRYLLGVVGSERKKVNPLKIIGYSFYEVKYWIAVTIDSLKLMVTGNVSLNDVSGPVGIVNTIGQTYTQSLEVSIFAVVVNLMNISILLTANLGVMNLLPIPALDGGRLIFLIIEAIRGKRVNPEKEAMVHFAGLMILLGLMVVIMANDIRNLF